MRIYVPTTIFYNREFTIYKISQFLQKGIATIFYNREITTLPWGMGKDEEEQKLKNPDKTHHTFFCVCVFLQYLLPFTKLNYRDFKNKKPEKETFKHLGW